MHAAIGLRSSTMAMGRMVTPMRRPSMALVAPRPSTLVAPSFVGGTAFSGSILAPARPVNNRGAVTVVAAGGNSMGNTLRGSRRSRRRTSGFRTRMQTASGRRVLAARRKKGRKCLVPASERSSAGKKQ